MKGHLVKILVASTNGTRADDFTYATPGEFVIESFICDSRSCGCDRAWSGVGSRRATTVFEVVETDRTRDDLFREVKESLTAGGWLDPADTSTEADDVVNDYLGFSLDVSAGFPVGTLVRGNYSRADNTWTFEGEVHV